MMKEKSLAWRRKEKAKGHKRSIFLLVCEVCNALRTIEKCRY